MISSSSNGGGAEKQFLETVLLLSEFHEVGICVIGTSGILLPKFIATNKVTYISKGNLYFDCVTIINALKHFKPDAVINWLYMADILGAFFSKMFGVKRIINTLRNTKWENYRAWKMQLVKFSCRFLASATVANSVKALDWHTSQGFDLIEMRVINNLLPHPLPDPSPSRSDASEFLRLGIASRAVSGKGHFTLFRTLEQYPEIASRVKLHFIGEGIENWNYLVTELNKLPVAHSIDSYKSNLDDWFANIDIYLAISESWESDSNSLIESILHQKPTICSVLQNLETIYPMPPVIPVGDSKGLARILRDFLNGNLLSREISFSAQRRECLISQRPRDRISSEWNRVLSF